VITVELKCCCVASTVGFAQRSGGGYRTAEELAMGNGQQQKNWRRLGLRRFGTCAVVLVLVLVLLSL
jgi:hypothetical protein